MRATHLTGALLVAVGLLVACGGTAAASTGSDAPPDPITLSPEQSRWVCEERVPALLRRIDRIEARIAGDADTPGSTAWLRECAACRERFAGWDLYEVHEDHE